MNMDLVLEIVSDLLPLFVGGIIAGLVALAYSTKGDLKDGR